jgi:hypothetical protein
LNPIGGVGRSLTFSTDASMGSNGIISRLASLAGDAQFVAEDNPIVSKNLTKPKKSRK